MASVLPTALENPIFVSLLWQWATLNYTLDTAAQRGGADGQPSDQLVGKLYVVQNIVDDNIETTRVYTHCTYTVSTISYIFSDCESI